MNEAFRQRLERGNQWAARVVGQLQQDGWLTVPMGAENVAPDVHDILSAMHNPDPTARFVRYMPDGFAVHPTQEKALFYDAKDGKTIEKDAYLVYLAFAGANRNVLLFIKTPSEDIYGIPVQDVRFKDSHAIVSQFPPDKQMPIDKDGWITPRLWPEWKYLKWKCKNQQASGTPYRYLDFAAMATYKQERDLPESSPRSR